MDNDELCVQIRQGINSQGCARFLLNALQVFILDVIDAFGGEEDTEGAFSLSVAKLKRVAEPDPLAAARLRKAVTKSKVPEPAGQAG